MKVFLSGSLGRDPEFRVTASGMDIASFSIPQKKKKKNGEETTTWWTIKSFSKSAEFVMKYFQKGTFVAVSGEGVINEYTNKDGVVVKAFEILANEFNPNWNTCKGKDDKKSEFNKQLKNKVAEDEDDDDDLY